MSMSNPILGFSTILILSVWFLFTLAEALPLSKKVSFKHPIISQFVPRWSFFAPNPGRYDFHILVRDELFDGSLTLWREVCSPAENRPWKSFIWNPGQREKKALFDVSQELVTSAQIWSGPQNLLILTVPYLTILNYISELDRPFFVHKTQFVIVTTSRQKLDPTISFTSGMHKLELSNPSIMGCS